MGGGGSHSDLENRPCARSGNWPAPGEHDYPEIVFPGPSPTVHVTAGNSRLQTDLAGHPAGAIAAGALLSGSRRATVGERLMAMLLQPPAVRICGLEMCPSSVRISLLRNSAFCASGTAGWPSQGKRCSAGRSLRRAGTSARHADSRARGNEDRREDGYEEGITPYECSTEYRSCARRVG
jgi:hypothetical protein